MSSIEYCTFNDVVSRLNLTEVSSSPGTYLMWGINVGGATIQAYVDDANDQIYAIVGDVRGDEKRFILAKLLARATAILRLIVFTTGGWLDTAYNFRLGDMNVEKGTAAYNALKSIASQAKEDILRYKVQLVGKTDGQTSTITRDYYTQEGTAIGY